MVTLINHLPVSQEQKLRNAISNIANEVALEKVICYGTRTRLGHTWSSFSAMLDSSMDTDYDLLFITKPEEKHRSHEILDIIDQHSTNDTRLVAIVHSQRAVSEALENGRFFFATVCRHGVLIYDASGIPLTIPADYTNPHQLTEFQEHWEQHFCLAKKFLDGASYYIVSGSPTLAVFMLHQATEHTCIAMIQACIDYRPTTHNLSRLLALTENISPCPTGLFPQTTEYETELFKTLLRAYSDARYDEDFKLPEEKARILKQRVASLQDFAEKLYNEKLSKIKNSNSNH